MTILRSRSVDPGQQLADAAAGEHRHRDLSGVRLVGAGLDEGFQFLGLHGFRDHYRPLLPDP
jgi:hypothetical protein